MLTWKKIPKFLAWLTGVLVLEEAFKALVRGQSFDLLGTIAAVLVIDGVIVITMATLTTTDWIVSHVEPDLRDGMRLVVAIPLVALVWVGLFWLMEQIP